jgi:uridine kinase
VKHALEILELLNNSAKKNLPCQVITIDGPAGAGKTTLARQLEELLTNSATGSLTIHMDDLYRGWDLALTDSLRDDLATLINQIKEGSKLSISKFDWQKNKLGAEESHPIPTLLILEGVGSGQSVTREMAALKIWIEIPVAEGLRRVIDRDGLAISKFMDSFIVAQTEHFAKEGTREAADYRISWAPDN